MGEKVGLKIPKQFSQSLLHKMDFVLDSSQAFS